jgi:hypothetical protein
MDLPHLNFGFRIAFRLQTTKWLLIIFCRPLSVNPKINRLRILQLCGEYSYLTDYQNMAK